jgi:hypothetical protein
LKVNAVPERNRALVQKLDWPPNDDATLPREPPFRHNFVRAKRQVVAFKQSAERENDANHERRFDELVEHRPAVEKQQGNKTILTRGITKCEHLVQRLTLTQLASTFQELVDR